MDDINRWYSRFDNIPNVSLTTPTWGGKRPQRRNKMSLNPIVRVTISLTINNSGNFIHIERGGDKEQINCYQRERTSWQFKKIGELLKEVGGRISVTYFTAGTFIHHYPPREMA